MASAAIYRFFPLVGGRLDEAAVNEAFEAKDFSGMTLKRILHQFLQERWALVNASVTSKQ